MSDRRENLVDDGVVESQMIQSVDLDTITTFSTISLDGEKDALLGEVVSFPDCDPNGVSPEREAALVAASIPTLPCQQGLSTIRNDQSSNSASTRGARGSQNRSISHDTKLFSPTRVSRRGKLYLCGKCRGPKKYHLCPVTTPHCKTCSIYEICGTYRRLKKIIVKFSEECNCCKENVTLTGSQAYDDSETSLSRTNNSKKSEDNSIAKIDVAQD